MTPARRKNLERLLLPRHIAFIGGEDAAIAIGEARRIGFTGEYWPVNPKRQSLAGIPCFSSVKDLPEAPDAIFLAIPATPAIQVLKQLRERGAGGAVCYTAGFGEVGEEGKAAEQNLIDAAGEMAVLGPNCYGMINYLDRVALWPFAHGGNSTGFGCAIITQSGMLSSDLTMAQRSIPMTHMISIGNQAVLRMEDLVDVLCEDERVRAIGLHIEGLKDVNQFARVALKSIRYGKPIVALKTGSSVIGKNLASSHTGSLSGEDDLYDALFDRIGIIRVFSPSQLLETLKFICVAGKPKGTRIAGFTCSGGGATMLADHAEKIGLNFPMFRSDVAKGLQRLLPSIATVSNPLDYTTPIWGQADRTRPVFSQALANDMDVAVLVQDYPAAGLDESKHFYLADAGAFAEATQAAQVPAAICSTLPENLDVRTREELVARGVAPMQGINECLDAITGVCAWQQRRVRILEHPPAELMTPEKEARQIPLDEYAAKALLVSAGIEIPAGEVCTRDDIQAAANRLGYPLALKLVHPELKHKTESGAVQLSLASPEEVKQVASRIIAQVQKRQPALVGARFLLEKMQQPPLAEMIVSIRHDNQFGMAMTLGSGGVLVELIDDCVTILLPASEQTIVDAIQKLRMYRLLQGFRGKPKAHLPVLVSSLAVLADYMIRNRKTVFELEINPLFVYKNSVCAVDALGSIVC